MHGLLPNVGEKIEWYGIMVSGRCCIAFLKMILDGAVVTVEQICQNVASE